MTITARFYVNAITERAGTGAREISLQVSTRGEENKTWARYTPSGSMTMNVKNDEAIFELGRDYLVTFELAE
jgi:hypothetical protein